MASSAVWSASRRIVLALGMISIAASASARDYRGHAPDGPQSVRVDVQMYGQGELNIKRWLEKYAGIDTDHYYLTGVVVHASGHHRGYGGHALLRVGSNYSPRIELRPGANHIRAPRFDDGKWRLYVREGAQVHAVTLLFEPRQVHAYDRRYDDDHGRRYDYDRRWDNGYRTPPPYEDHPAQPWPPSGSPLGRQHHHDRHCRH